MKLSPSSELILRAIAHREMFGQEIARTIQECCDRRIREQSLYRSLKQLHQEKLVTKRSEVSNGTVRDYYRLTEAGINALNKINEGHEKLKNWEQDNG